MVNFEAANRFNKDFCRKLSPEVINLNTWRFAGCLCVCVYLCICFNKYLST